MKVAVTGASGFVGRYVLRELARHDDLEIVASSRHIFDEALALKPRVRHVCLDVSQPSAGDFAALGRPDTVIHLAWAGLPNYRSPHHYETHLGEQYRFLSGLVEQGLASLLCTGTCFEYGMRAGELHEDMVADPQNPYGFAKDALRRELQFLKARREFKLTWTRLFYMYGEGQAPASLYSLLMAAGRSGAQSFKMSAGEQLRDFMPIEAVAQTIVRLALHVPDAGVVNICSGQPVSVRGMVERWLQQNNWQMQLQLGHYPYPDYEPMAFWGSNRRLNRLLSTLPT